MHTDSSIYDYQWGSSEPPNPPKYQTGIQISTTLAAKQGKALFDKSRFYYSRKKKSTVDGFYFYVDASYLAPAWCGELLFA